MQISLGRSDDRAARVEDVTGAEQVMSGGQVRRYPLTAGSNGWPVINGLVDLLKVDQGGSLGQAEQQRRDVGAAGTPAEPV